MSKLARHERRQIDRQIEKSKEAIKAHLKFLNAAGNPQYTLKKIYPIKQRLKDMVGIK